MYEEGGVVGAPCVEREGYGSTMCEEGGFVGVPCVKREGLWEHHV